MAGIVFPTRSRFAIAQREPRLLVPGRKPIRRVEIDFAKMPSGLESAFIFQNSNGYDHATRQAYTQVGLASGVDANDSYIRGTSYAGAHYQQAPAFNCTSWSGATCVAFCVADFNQYPGLIASVSVGNYYGNFLLSGDSTAGEFIFRAGNSPTYARSSGVTAGDLVFVAGVWDKANLQVHSAIDGGSLVSGTPVAQTTGFVGTAAENYIGYYSRSGGRSYTQPIYAALVFNRALSTAELTRLKDSLYGGFKPANSTPYLFPVAASGGATGTGDLVGPGSDIAGTGWRTAVGSGVLEGQGAAIVGTGDRTITGAGILVGQGADITGEGATGGVVSGAGDLVGAGAEIVGTGERTVIGTGALVAQGSAIVGTGERTIIGSGDLIGAGSEIVGAGAVGGVTTGTGDLVGAGSEIIGTGERTVVGTGALVAQGSAVVGVGERTIVGAGDLVGSGSAIEGAGAAGDITTGAGDLVGAGSAVTGTGVRIITGTADLVAAGSIIVGAGLRTVTGSGALVGAGSAIVGSAAHQFVDGNTNRTWLLSPRGRVWSLSRDD